MPIHIHPASVAQGKYFPKLSINRKTIFEQLRAETERVRKGRRWRGTGGEIFILYVYMIHIHNGAGPSHESGDRLCRTGRYLIQPRRVVETGLLVF